MTTEILKLLTQAHTNITRRKGKEYAPTAQELQAEIDKMNNQIEVTFTHDNQDYSFTIYPTEPDWWVYIEDLFDIHYCEDYNEICVYKSQDYSTTIHKQKIKDQ